MESYDTMTRGYVFDIRRFSTHDGDGIRTTVFLKGCPLRCVWCHNPEGLTLQPQLVYLENHCIHCGMCVDVCETGAFRFEQGKLQIDKSAPEDWAEIIDACPAACLTMDAQSYTVGELLEEVLKDQAFFRHGGGVTFSGGEPLLQKEFLLAALKECKTAGIHTAIETSLYAETQTVLQVLEHLDLLYADFKVFQPEQHRAWTGVDNDLIKENLRRLLQSEKREQLIVRTPLIPTMTGQVENVTEIARFISSLYPEVKYELLNYNPLAKAKYALVGLEYCFADNPPMYTEGEMETFRAAARQAGTRHLLVEV